MLIQWMLIITLLGSGGEQPEKDRKDEPEVHEALVVWGTEVKSSTLKVKEDTISIKQPDHVSDLLRTIPGVDVGGAHSLNQRITMRALEDRDIAISIDGASQNTYMYHHMGNLQIHADILKAVDIEVGRNSVLHAGMGGAVRFETKSADDLLGSDKRFGSRLQASYHDNASSGLSATFFSKLGQNLDLMAYYNQVQRNDYEVGGGKITGSDGLVVPGTNGEVRGHEGDVDDLLIKFGWNLGTTQRLELGYENYEDIGDYSYRPDMGLATDQAIADNMGLPLVYPTEFTRDTLTLNHTATLGNHTHFKGTLFHNTSNLWRDETSVQTVFGGAAIIEGEAQNQGMRLHGETFLDSGSMDHQLKYGATYIDYETEYKTDGHSAASESSAHLALYIEDQVGIGSRFNVKPGIRYDQMKVDSAVVENTFSHLSGSLALEYEASPYLVIRAGSTQMFKAPEIAEVFVGAGLYDSPNSDIENETGLNTEISLSFTGPLENGRQWQAGFSIYQTKIDDYIYDYAPHPEFRSWRDNIGDLKLDGIELYLGHNWGQFNSLISYSNMDSELDAFEAYGSIDGGRLDRHQGDTFSLNLDYEIPGRGLNLHWDSLIVEDLGAGMVLNGATLDNAKDGYHVHNISVRWQPAQLRGLTILFGVDNLLDEYYASQSSRTGVSFHPRFGELYLVDYEPGRNIKTSLTYQF